MPTPTPAAELDALEVEGTMVLGEDAMINWITRTLTALRTLRAALAEARADTERIDRLERHHVSIGRYGNLWWANAPTCRSSPLDPDWRAAADAALAAVKNA